MDSLLKCLFFIPCSSSSANTPMSDKQDNEKLQQLYGNVGAKELINRKLKVS